MRVKLLRIFKDILLLSWAIAVFSAFRGLNFLDSVRGVWAFINLLVFPMVVFLGVGDNPANRELLTPQYDALFCPMGNDVALADAILTLAKDDQLRAYLGNNALRTFQERASINALQPQLYHIIETISV